MKDQTMNDEPENNAQHEQPESLVFPCLLWEPSLNAVLLATNMGVGTVLHPGQSRVLRIGMVVPYAASRWTSDREEWDFILPPPDTQVRLQNTARTADHPITLQVEVKYLDSNSN